MTAPRPPEPLTEREERALRLLDESRPMMLSVAGGLVEVRSVIATLDAARAQLAQVERERDEARKHPGINDPRVAAINDAVEDFITRRTEPRLVCFHVPVIECEVLMFAVGKGLPKAIAYAQFIRTLERSAGIEAGSSAADRADALQAERDALLAEVAAWREVDDAILEAGVRVLTSGAMDEARRLRAQSEGGERAE